VCKVAGAVLVMVSHIEFIWYATTISHKKATDEMVSSEDMADQPMPADLMAALIQIMTFVSFAVLMFMSLDFSAFFESEC